MDNLYKYKKKNFSKQDISYIRIFFDNSDYIQIESKEVVDIKIEMYDKLIVENNLNSPVAKNGFVKLKLLNKVKQYGTSNFVYNPNDFKAGRKEYLINRLCNEGGLKCLHIHDELNWHDVIYGNMVARAEDE